MTLPLSPLFEPPPELAMARPFWEAVERGELVLPRCSACGRWQWYPEPSGTDCPGGVLRWEPVAASGTIYTFTRVHRSFLPGGREHAPYVVGLVDLDGVDGPRLVARLADHAGLAVGARVKASFASGPQRAPVAFELEPDIGRGG